MRTRTRPQRWRLLALLTALGLVLAACGADDDGAAPTTEPEEAPDTEDPAEEPTDAEEPDEPAAVELDPVGPVQVGTIAIPPIFAMVMAEVAAEAGFYDKYNVEVEMRPMETGVDAARAVQGGDLDAAFSPTGPVMTFAGTGVDVTALMGYDNIDWLIGSTNPDVQSCEDLAGETIGVDSVGGARYSVLQIILDSCGLEIDDIDVASFPGAAAIQAVAAGQLDTVVIHIDDVFVIEEQGGTEMHIVEFLRDVDPDQHYLVFWALDATVEQSREELVRVLAALIDATRYMNDPANEDEVVRIGTATGHSEEVVRASLADFLDLEFWPLDRHGLPEEGIEATIETQVRLENIPEEDAPSYEDVVDTSLWDEAFDLVEQMNGS